MGSEHYINSNQSSFVERTRHLSNEKRRDETGLCFPTEFSYFTGIARPHPPQNKSGRDSFCVEPIDADQPAFSFVDYSLMKHGFPAAARRLGQLMARAFIQSHRQTLLSVDSSRISVATSAYFNVPTASRQGRDTLLGELNYFLFQHGRQPARPVHIMRHSTVQGDYATLPEAERERRRRETFLSCDPENIRDRFVFLVDDCLITGGHLNNLREAVEGHEPRSVTHLTFVKIVNGREYPTVEYYLNTAHVSDAQTFLDLALESASPVGITLNDRVIKTLFSNHRTHPDMLRRYLYELLDKHDSAVEHLWELRDCVLGNGYALMEEYQKNFFVLLDILRKIHSTSSKTSWESVSLGLHPEPKANFRD